MFRQRRGIRRSCIFTAMAALWSIAFRVFLALTASGYGLLAIYPIVAMAARLARLPTVDRYTADRRIIETA